jgi:uncharacterized membrane protein
MKMKRLAQFCSCLAAIAMVVPSAVAATSLPLAVVVPMPEPGVVGLLAIDLAAVGGLIFVLRRPGRRKD